jgi:choline kinase
MRTDKKFITSPKISRSSGKKTDFVSVVLFSENHGYRMKSYGPIPLIKIDGKSVIERQIDSIKSIFSNFEIILCSGFETEKTVNFIKEHFSDINIRVVENQVHYNSNCCESARLCINNTTSNKIILCGGGVLLTSECLNMIDLNTSMIIYQNQNDDSNFEVGVISNNNKLEGLSIGVKNQYWTELLYLSNSKIIKILYSILSNPEYKNKFVFEAINQLPNISNISTKKNKHEPIIKVNSIKTLKRITNI